MLNPLTFFKNKYSLTLFIIIYFSSRLIILFNDHPGSDLHYYSEIAYELHLHSKETYNIYENRNIEYPPLALTVISLPNLFFDTISSLQSFKYKYFILYRYMMFVFDIGIILNLILLCSRYFDRKRLSLIIALYTIATFLLKDIIYDRLDIVMIFLTFTSFHLLIKQKKILSALFICMGIYYKFIPIIFLPIWSLSLQFLSAKKLKSFRDFLTDTLKNLSIILIILFAFSAFYIKVYGPSIFDFLEYHSKRGIQIESIYSNVIMVLSFLDIKYAIQNSYGSQNIISNISPYSNLISPLLIILGELFVLKKFLKIMLSKRIFSEQDKVIFITKYFSLTLLISLIFSKVLSTQYILFIIPFLTLLFIYKDFQKIIYIYFCCILLTSLIFPKYYWSDIALQNIQGYGSPTLFGIFILTARNIALVLLPIYINGKPKHTKGFGTFNTFKRLTIFKSSGKVDLRNN